MAQWSCYSWDESSHGLYGHCAENPIYVFPEIKLRGLDPICSWAVHFLCMVRQWYVPGMFMVYTWSVHGMCNSAWYVLLVSAWFVHGVCVVCLWFVKVHGWVHDMCMVCAGSVQGLCRAVVGKHPDLLVGPPTLTVFPTNDRNVEISQFFAKNFETV